MGLGSTLLYLANLYRKQGKYGEIEPLYKRGLAIREKAFGENHPSIVVFLNSLASLYAQQSKRVEAEALYKRALAIEENTLGNTHPDEVWATLNGLVGIYNATGNVERALTYSRKAVSAAIAHTAAEAAAAQKKQNEDGLAGPSISPFRGHVRNLAIGAGKRIKPKAALAHEALETAQWASHSSASAALAQMSARFASGNSALTSLIRERQDLSAAWRDPRKWLEP